MSKEYRRNYYLENKEKHKKAVSLYNSKNSEKIKKYQKKWYEDNKEIIKERNRLYYLQNIEKVRKYQKDYYLENEEKVKKYQSKYRLVNKKKVNVKSRNLIDLYGESAVLEASKRGMNVKRFVTELKEVASIEKREDLQTKKRNK